MNEQEYDALMLVAVAKEKEVERLRKALGEINDIRLLV